MEIRLENICVSYDGNQVLKDFSASFPYGSVTCLMGPSGCGKSSLLNVIAGLVKPESGTVEGVSGLRMAYAFQEPRLLPWKTVAENVAFVLPEGLAAAEREALVGRALDFVELADSASLKPAQLSGGMAQRASLARALAAIRTGTTGNVSVRKCLLLDEPFSALDVALKQRIASRLKSFQTAEKLTVIMVTHSPEEAELLNAKLERVGPIGD